MPFGFVGRITPATTLKEGLDVSSQRTRVIASRVAQASVLPPGGFALPEPGTAPGSPATGNVDLEAEMVSLADEQLRFEATARLLQKAYQGVRTSLKNG